jgi:hypothetical protein
VKRKHENAITYFVSDANSRRRQVTCVLDPDRHTSVFIRDSLQRILNERYGINDAPLVKNFRVQS